MLGNRREEIGRREGDVQEEADLLLDALEAQFLGERDQMVVVHPDEVVGFDEGGERPGEPLVDAPIAFEKRMLVDREVEPVVEGRPQCAVREAEIILFILAARQRDRRRPDAAVLLQFDAERGLVVLDDGAVPAEPQAAAALQCVFQRHREAAGLDGLVEIGNAIGRNDQSAHTVDSQGLDSLTAPLMIPTME